jgi:hypothetical protein
MSQPTKTEPWQSAARAIASGKCDEHLVDIAQALQLRVLEAAVLTQWHLKYGELDVTESELTLDEWERWTTLAEGGSWQTLKPLQSARASRTLLQVLIETRLGQTAEEAEAQARTIVGSVLLGSFTEEQVPDPFGRPEG